MALVRHLLPVMTAALLMQQAQGAGPSGDPTRPPSIADNAPSKTLHPAARVPARPVPPAQGVAPAPAMPRQPPPAPPTLQAVQVPRQGEASAIVDGRLVRVGDALDSATVLAIDVDGLTLRVATGTRRLWLLGAVVQPAATSRVAAPLVTDTSTASTPVGSTPAPVPSRPPVAALNGRQP